MPEQSISCYKSELSFFKFSDNSDRHPAVLNPVSHYDDIGTHFFQLNSLV